jgi:hypothetical protein
MASPQFDLAGRTAPITDAYPSHVLLPVVPR